MITDDIRQEKKEDMDRICHECCLEWERGNYEASSRQFSRLTAFGDAFRGIDSDLFWHGVHLNTVIVEFQTSDSDDNFNAWAVGQACNALRAAA